MKNAILFTTWLSLIVLLCFSGCSDQPSSGKVLAEAIRKINNNEVLHYQYQSFWDTRLNGTTFSDSATLIRAKVDSSFHGFGFYGLSRGNEFLFDGTHYQVIRHGDKMIVRHDPAAIKTDPDYFPMIFSLHPGSLPQSTNFELVFPATITNKKYYVYKTESKKPSMADTTKIVRSERFYYVASKDQTLQQIQDISIIETDTLQIIDHYFSNIRFEKGPYPFQNIDRSGALAYIEISAEDLDNERFTKQIKVGDSLSVRSYQDINDQQVLLYGDTDHQTLILFSFIGCGGCEYALRELKKEKYRIKEGINFYYSSPQNHQQALQAYLAKKGFPFPAFSKESKMNEEFSIVSYPTFVLINAEGVVKKVLWGYDEELKNLIF